jgi:ribosomal protein S27E
MSTKIGGPFRCNIHEDFPETDDVNVWNQHCLETEGHTITGTVRCSNCGEVDIAFDQIPYQEIGKELKLQCPDCFNKNQDLNRLVNDSAFLKSQQYQQGAQGESLK